MRDSANEDEAKEHRGGNLTERERAILMGFWDGSVIVNKEESDLLRRWANVGLVTFGVDPEYGGTAKLTETGKRLVPTL